jgi:hypothetical protein
MLALKDACISPKTKKPYIQTSVGGRDNSPEGHQVVILRLAQLILWLLMSAGRLFSWIRILLRKRGGSEVLLRTGSGTSSIRKELGWGNTESEGGRFCTWCILARCMQPCSQWISIYCRYESYPPLYPCTSIQCIAPSNAYAAMPVLL